MPLRSNFPAKIIDSHHHLWTPEQFDPDIGYKWLRDIGSPKPFGDPTPIQRDYLLEEFRSEQDIAELAGSVHLQCDPGLPDPVAETRFIQSLSDDSGFKIAIVGFVDLSRHDAPTVIEQHLERQHFVGVRQILSKLDDRPEISFAPKHFLEDQVWRENYATLKDYNLSFDLQIYPEQMGQAAEFLSEHPETPVIIDHAGSPHDQSAEGMKTWQEGLAHLASLPNTSIKLAGFGMFDVNWNSDTIKPMVETILDLYGVNRVMFGSNFPVDKLMATYLHSIQSVTEALGPLGVSDINAIYHDNAKRIYRM